MKRRALALLLAAPFSAACAASQQPDSASAQQPASAQQLVRSGVEARKHGQLKAAIEDFRNALVLQPGLVDAQIALGSALVAAGDLDNAIDVDRHALQASPDNAALRTNLGLAYYRAGDMNNARRELEAVHQGHPGDLPSAVLLADTYNKLNRESDAVAVLAPLEAGHESDLDLEYALGYAMIQTGNVKGGAQRIEKIAEARRSAEAWMIAGLAHFHANEFRPARDDAEKAIALDPALAAAWTLDGQARYILQDTPGAIKSLQAALQRNPRDFDANLYLGIERAKERDFDTARPLLELAVELQPKYPLARLELAKLYVATGRQVEALRMLQDLTRDEPGWFDAHWELASLYFDLQRPEDGKRERAIAHQLQQKQQKK